MEKFMKELEDAKNPWIVRIGNYLLSRNDIHNNLKKENKTLQECFDYILVELSIKAVRDGNVGFVAGDDEELFSLAVHYYDEDELEIDEINFKTNANGTADASSLIKKDNKHEHENKSVEQEEITKPVEKPKTKKKVAKTQTPDNQISIFDI